jgi:HK97 family phage major capsid protein
MSEISEITRLREQRHELVQQMRRVIDKADAEGRDLSAEELAEIETREEEIKPLDRQISARELTLRLTPTLKEGDERSLTENRETAVQKPVTETEEYRTAFDHYLRGMERRDQLLSPNTSGGYTVPRGFLNELIEYRTHFGVVRGLANTFSTSGGNTMDLPLLTGRGAAGWTSEGAAYNEADETFGSVTFGAHKMTRIVQVSEELLQDSAFDIQSMLARRFGQSLAVLENTAFIAGTGSGQPKGMATVGGLATGKTTGGATAITFDEVIDLSHSVIPPYRQNAVWLMSDGILAYLRKIKTGVASDNRYIWQESATAGAPSLLWGFPWYIDPDMAGTSGGNPVTATRTMIFGDLTQAYWIRDAGPIAVRRLDERYADNGLVGFLVSARVDGQVVDNGAAKVMLQA